MAFKMRGFSGFKQIKPTTNPEEKKKATVSKNIIYRDYPRTTERGDVNPSGSESEEYVYTDDPRHPDYQRLDDLGLE